jgi:CheY-like chemotaxis protein
MSKEFQEHLFEPFTQENRNDILENRGTGLGLSIVKQLVDAFAGTVEVESAPGKGTIFTVKIISPVVKRDYVEAKKEQERNKIKDFEMLAGKRVLLCEDHPLNQEIAKTLLENVGTKVEIAENGKDGLDAFIHSALNYFDCILMDIRMPVLNGVEATKAIRSLERADAKTIPVIAMTADAFKEDVNKCLDAGMNGHIAKPIEPERLYETLLTKISKN